MESLTSGTLAGTGSFRCEECGYVVTLAAEDELPACPGCGGARFARPTVSRRHALIVRQADGVRVLDDRSLNGVFVNGERVEWRVLTDGDEIVVGRYRLHFLEAAPEIAATEAPPLETTG